MEGSMDQVIRIIEIIFRSSLSKSQNLSRQFLLLLRKFLILTLVALGSVLLFCVGVAIVVVDLARYIERPALLGGALALLAGITIMICLRQRAWLKVADLPDAGSLPKGPGPMEQALALLITDLVEERKAKRNATDAGPDAPPVAPEI
jgi:hypothetical protein